MKKWFKENLGAILGVLVVVWIVASWVNVNAHNDPFASGYGDFAWWNLFNVFDYM